MHHSRVMSVKTKDYMKDLLYDLVTIICPPFAIITILPLIPNLIL